VTWLLRLGELTFSPALGQGLLTATPVNVLNLFYSAIEPVLASIGFLLMYNESAQAELKRLARTDPLTGALNRLALDEEAERLFRRSATGTGHTCAALMIDVDHFKVINDRYGHAGGDLALMALATRIDQHRRAGDVLGRAGGEEFLMLLPDTGMPSAPAATAWPPRRSPLPHRASGSPIRFETAVVAVCQPAGPPSDWKGDDDDQCPRWSGLTRSGSSNRLGRRPVLPIAMIGRWQESSVAPFLPRHLPSPCLPSGNSRPRHAGHGDCRKILQSSLTKRPSLISM